METMSKPVTLSDPNDRKMADILASLRDMRGLAQEERITDLLAYLKRVTDLYVRDE